MLAKRAADIIREKGLPVAEAALIMADNDWQSRQSDVMIATGYAKIRDTHRAVILSEMKM